jgi:hypothetical protein
VKEGRKGGREEGMKEGRKDGGAKEGRKGGREEGRKDGRKDGRKEGRKRPCRDGRRPCRPDALVLESGGNARNGMPSTALSALIIVATTVSSRNEFSENELLVVQ